MGYIHIDIITYYAVMVLECDGALIWTNIFMNPCILNSGTALFYGAGRLAICKDLKKCVALKHGTM